MACLIGNITSLRKNQFNAISSSAFFFVFQVDVSTDIRPLIYLVLFIPFCEVPIMAALFSLEQLYYLLTLLIKLHISINYSLASGYT